MLKINCVHRTVARCRATNSGTEFLFILDVIVVNVYIIYLDCLANVNHGRATLTPMTHLQFKKGLCEALLVDWEMQSGEPLPLASEQLVICTPTYSVLQCLCVVCNAHDIH